MTFPQLLEAIAEHSRASSHSSEAEVLAAFHALDPTARGTVPPKELRRLLTLVGEKLTNNEGTINYECSNVLNGDSLESTLRRDFHYVTLSSIMLCVL